MQLAAISQADNDMIAAWQAANGAEWCERLRASITKKHCQQQRYISSASWSDCRCTGCGGLHNQHIHKSVRPNLALIRSIDQMIADATDDEAALPSGSASTSSQNDALSVLDEIICSLYENPASGDDFDDVELDLDDEQLLALFPELALNEEEAATDTNYPRLTEYQEATKPRAVYKGTCERCKGYMDDIRERFDDNVFHCLLCGWRTSEEYERNRAIYGVTS